MYVSRQEVPFVADRRRLDPPRAFKVLRGEGRPKGVADRRPCLKLADPLPPLRDPLEVHPELLLWPAPDKS